MFLRPAVSFHTNSFHEQGPGSLYPLLFGAMEFNRRNPSAWCVGRGVSVFRCSKYLRYCRYP